MSLKKILLSALCALCAVSLLIPAAFAHGGCHGRTGARQYRIPVCTVEDCELAGRHYHNGSIYCGSDHAAGYCGGTCPYTQPSNAWGSWSGCRGGHCGW